MVAAYSAMTRDMPDNGTQVVMFTHQNAGVCADLGGILWAAGLKVSSAWNVVTETEKPSGEGNYVQGTVCLVLRKRAGEANARRMEIEAEIEEAVAARIGQLTALDDVWHERANAEPLYTDGDLTLAAYAAALEVVTAYSSIDRQPLDRDLYRKLGKGETTMLRELSSVPRRSQTAFSSLQASPTTCGAISRPPSGSTSACSNGGQGLDQGRGLSELRQEFRLRRLRLAHGLDRRQRGDAGRRSRPQGPDARR